MKRRRLLELFGYWVAGVGALAAGVPFVKYLLPSAKARARGDPVEVDLSELAPGELRVMEWRGRPIFLLRRTPAMLASLAEMTPHLLDSNVTDPEFQPPYVDPVTRSIEPEFLVLDGTCTHLGCVPNPLPDAADPAVGPWWRGGFLCACHQSAYDYAGRVVQRPAPRNLRVPKYRFVGRDRVVIGEDAGGRSGQAPEVE